MLRHRSRKKYHSLVIFMAVILFFLSSLVTAEASLRPLNLNILMERSLLRFRKVEVNGNVFDISINQKEKSITVQGEVEGLEEKEIVEKYFRLRAPSDFQINYDISIIY